MEQMEKEMAQKPLVLELELANLRLCIEVEDEANCKHEEERWPRFG